MSQTGFLVRGVLVLAGLGLLVGNHHTPAHADPPDRVPGRLLVRFRADVDEGRKNGLENAVGARKVGELPGLGIHVLQLPPNASEVAMAHAFGQQDEVEFAEPDAICPVQDVTPNDPLFSGSEWHLKKISCPTAWATNTGSSGITVAVLDTGVNANHPDLAPRIVPGWNVYNNTADTSDVYGHGTEVAGTIGACTNNGTGVAAVTWNCRIMPIRISATDGSATYSAMAAGLTWAADHGARVANISYMASTSAAVTSAAQYFQSKGGVVTSSAGNYATFDSSADNPYILTVSATDSNDSLYSWSNTGNNVDLAAPGSVYTTTADGNYGSAAGTSFSAPIVAGVAALVISQNPNLTGQQVQDVLKQGADDLGTVGWDPQYGWGRVNAAKALALAGGGGSLAAPPAAPIVDTTPPVVSFASPASGAVVANTMSVQVSASDNLAVASVSLSVDGVSLGTDSAAPYSFSWPTLNYANGAHTLTAQAVDTSGNIATATLSVTVNNVPDTTAPTVSIVSPAGGTSLNGNVTVQASASDNVGVVRVELYVDGKLQAADASAPWTFSLNTKKLGSGSHSLQCKAYDAAGNVGSSALVTVTTR